MRRITVKHLEAKITYLNELTGNPKTKYIKNKETGQFEPQAYCFILDRAYGGFELQQMCGTGTGVSTPLNTGHIPARELAGLIDAMIVGLTLSPPRMRNNWRLPTRNL